jgi:hypothetical protein
MVEKRNAYTISVIEAKGKSPIRISRCRWEDNVKMNFVKIGWGGMDCSNLVQDKDQWPTFMNTIMNLRVPQNVWMSDWRLLKKGSAP